MQDDRSTPPDVPLDGHLAAMAQGDEAALNAVWAAIMPSLCGIATRYTGSAADGEEVAQETMMRAWQSAYRFDPTRGSARTWIYTILRNAARDRLRRRQVRWLVGLDALPNTPASDAPDADAELAARQELNRTRAALNDLPERQRMALLLASVGGLEATEIADIMRISRGAAEQLIARARARLRDMVGRT